MRVEERPAPRRGYWRTYLTDTVTQADLDSETYRAITPPNVATRDMIIVMVTSALSLTMINFFAKDLTWIQQLLDTVSPSLSETWKNWLWGSSATQFRQLEIWVLVQLVAYIVLPVVAIRMMGRRVRDYGLRARGLSGHWRIYLALFVISAPAIVMASRSAAFLAKYPFYDLADGEGFWPYMVAWWVLYAVQFVALEFFFRGFMVHGLKGRLGYAAVFVMVIPYNMIHFNKPLLEAIGAILGGITLGTLSLRSRSIWWGAALHIAVAATMDILALGQKGLL